MLANRLCSGTVGVLFHVSIKAVEVNAEPQATILLPYQYHQTLASNADGSKPSQPAVGESA